MKPWLWACQMGPSPADHCILRVAMAVNRASWKRSCKLLKEARQRVFLWRQRRDLYAQWYLEGLFHHSHYHDPAMCPFRNLLRVSQRPLFRMEKVVISSNGKCSSKFHLQKSPNMTDVGNKGEIIRCHIALLQDDGTGVRK